MTIESVTPAGQSDGMPTDRGVALSLFSGAGGFDLGVEAAGFRVAAALEIDGDAADTMEKNFGHLYSEVLRTDILRTPTKDLLRSAGLAGTERPRTLGRRAALYAFLEI